MSSGQRREQGGICGSMAEPSSAGRLLPGREQGGNCGSAADCSSTGTDHQLLECMSSGQRRVQGGIGGSMAGQCSADRLLPGREQGGNGGSAADLSSAMPPWQTAPQPWTWPPAGLPMAWPGTPPALPVSTAQDTAAAMAEAVAAVAAKAAAAEAAVAAVAVKAAAAEAAATAAAKAAAAATAATAAAAAKEKKKAAAAAAAAAAAKAAAALAATAAATAAAAAKENKAPAMQVAALAGEKKKGAKRCGHRRSSSPSCSTTTSSSEGTKDEIRRRARHRPRRKHKRRGNASKGPSGKRRKTVGHMRRRKLQMQEQPASPERGGRAERSLECESRRQRRTTAQSSDRAEGSPDGESGRQRRAPAKKGGRAEGSLECESRRQHRTTDQRSGRTEGSPDGESGRQRRAPAEEGGRGEGRLECESRRQRRTTEADVQVEAGGLSRRVALGPLSHSPRRDLDVASREDENEEAGCAGLGEADCHGDKGGGAGFGALGQGLSPTEADVQVEAGGLSRRVALGPQSHSPRRDLDVASREDENEERCGSSRQHQRTAEEDKQATHLPVTAPTAGSRVVTAAYGAAAEREHNASMPCQSTARDLVHNIVKHNCEALPCGLVEPILSDEGCHAGEGPYTGGVAIIGGAVLSRVPEDKGHNIVKFNCEAWPRDLVEPILSDEGFHAEEGPYTGGGHHRRRGAEHGPGGQGSQHREVQL